MALEWHPDKHLEEDKEKAEKMFHDISEAHEVLSDDDLRARYDRGEDVMSNQGQQQRSQGNPFGGNPFGGFQNFHQGGGGQQFHFKF